MLAKPEATVALYLSLLAQPIGTWDIHHESCERENSLCGAWSIYHISGLCGLPVGPSLVLWYPTTGTPRLLAPFLPSSRYCPFMKAVIIIRGHHTLALPPLLPLHMLIYSLFLGPGRNLRK